MKFWELSSEKEREWLIQCIMNKKDKVMEWISVKNELPKNEEVILIYGELKIGSYYDLSTFINGKFVDIDFPKRKHNITHWMELPDPPKD